MICCASSPRPSSIEFNPASSSRPPPESDWSPPRALSRRQQQRPRLEEPFRLLARPLQHVAVARDRAHRLDKRLEEPSLARELELRSLVPPALAHDQRRGDDSRERNRRGKAG